MKVTEGTQDEAYSYLLFYNRNKLSVEASEALRHIKITSSGRLKQYLKTKYVQEAKQVTFIWSKGHKYNYLIH